MPRAAGNRFGRELSKMMFLRLPQFFRFQFQFISKRLWRHSEIWVLGLMAIRTDKLAPGRQKWLFLANFWAGGVLITPNKTLAEMSEEQNSREQRNTPQGDMYRSQNDRARQVLVDADRNAT